MTLVEAKLFSILTDQNQQKRKWITVAFKSQPRAQQSKMPLKRGNKMSGPEGPQRTSL